jgi:uncharacterized protein
MVAACHSMRGDVLMRTRGVLAILLIVLAFMAGALSWAAYVLHETAVDAVMDVAKVGIGLAVFGLLLAAGGLILTRTPGRGARIAGTAAGAAALAAAGLLLTVRYLPFTVREIHIEGDDATLAGSLHEPRGGRNTPAVVLVHGSGPESRAEYAFYARYLARRGIAALAYDKRGVGASTGELYGSGYDDYARDVGRAVRRIRSLPTVDPDRVGLVGFSEGEWVAPLAMARDDSIAFIALIGASGLSPAEQVTAEMAMRLRNRGHPETVVRRAIAVHEGVLEYQRNGERADALNEALRAAAAEPWFTDAEDLPQDVGPRRCYAWAEWWRAVMDVSPDSLWPRVGAPVLLLKGGRDDRSPPEHQQRIVAALKRGGNEAVAVRIFPDADHMLLEWPRGGPPPAFADGYLETLVRWIDDARSVNASAGAPPRITPGHSLLNAEMIAAGTDTFDLIILRPDGGEQHISSVVRMTRRDVADGVATWVMVQSHESRGSSSSDTSVVRSGDFAPLRYAAVLPTEVHRFGFHPKSIEGTVQPADSAVRSLRIATDPTPFNAVMDMDVIRALPLRHGFLAELESYNPPAPAGHVTRVRVLRLDTLLTAAGAVPAWAVDYRSTGAPTVVWIGRDDHQFIALRSELSNGDAFWKLHQRDREAWRAQRSSRAPAG